MLKCFKLIRNLFYIIYLTMTTFLEGGHG